MPGGKSEGNEEMQKSGGYFLWATDCWVWGSTVFRGRRKGLIWKIVFLVSFVCSVQGMAYVASRVPSLVYCETVLPPMCPWLLCHKWMDRLHVGWIFGPPILFLWSVHLPHCQSYSFGDCSFWYCWSQNVRCLQPVHLSEDFIDYLGSFMFLHDD